MSELNIEAKTENLDQVTEYVNRHLEEKGCRMKTQMQIDMAVEEIFVNIARYAYHPAVGRATVRVEVLDDPLSVMITFIDNGDPFDPLAKENPDVGLSAQERSIGGLGIYMVKKCMDEISYEYRDGQNILRIKKDI